MIDPAIEHHARRRDHPRAFARSQQIGIGRFKSHLVVERSDHELTHRERRPFGKERLDPKIVVHPLDLREIERPVQALGQPAVIDPFAAQPHACRLAVPPQRAVADRAQVPRDLVGQHLLQPEAEQMRGIATVGPREDVAAASR